MFVWNLPTLSSSQVLHSSRTGSHRGEKWDPLLVPLPGLWPDEVTGLLHLEAVFLHFLLVVHLPCLSLANSHSFFKAFKCHLLSEAPLECPVRIHRGAPGRTFFVVPQVAGIASSLITSAAINWAPGVCRCCSYSPFNPHNKPAGRGYYSQVTAF